MEVKSTNSSSSSVAAANRDIPRKLSTMSDCTASATSHPRGERDRGGQERVVEHVVREELARADAEDHAERHGATGSRT